MQRFNVASTSTLRRLITCDEIFRRLGETNIGYLALGTRRSNIDADTTLLRRIDVNIASFDNVTKVFKGWGANIRSLALLASKLHHQNVMPMSMQLLEPHRLPNLVWTSSRWGLERAEGFFYFHPY